MFVQPNVHNGLETEILQLVEMSNSRVAASVKTREDFREVWGKPRPIRSGRLTFARLR